MASEHQRSADSRKPVWGILVAAGRGVRFGGEKHTVDIDGVPMWQRSRDALIAGGVDRVVVVGDVAGAITGGERRRDSVAAGLAEIIDEDCFVLVHDAARPLASPELVGRVVERLRAGDVDGVVPVVPVRDTLKRIRDGVVIETVDRSDLAAVQTPQGFTVVSLREAHASAPGDATDDASMVEGMGGVVATVAGEADNIKVTFPEDLALVLALRSRAYD